MKHELRKRAQPIRRGWRRYMCDEISVDVIDMPYGKVERFFSSFSSSCFLTAARLQCVWFLTKKKKILNNIRWVEHVKWQIKTKQKKNSGE